MKEQIYILTKGKEYTFSNYWNAVRFAKRTIKYIYFSKQKQKRTYLRLL